MKRLCVIGSPVSHSKSPLIQNAMLGALGLSDYHYDAREVPPGGLPAWLEAARREGYVGFNATMPHKEDLLPLLDVVSPEAAAARSVNTVCTRDGKLYGFSTDGQGFLQSLRGAGIDPAAREVVLLGAGGAAKAVSLALARAGGRAVTVCNRTPDKAAALCALLPPGFARPAGFDPQTLAACVRRSDLVVNCTSLGMHGTGAQFSDFSFLDAMPPHAAVCDLIYSPAETALLAAARLRGHAAFNGLGMLIYQAIFSLEHFIRRTLNADTMYRLVLHVLSDGARS